MFTSLQRRLILCAVTLAVLFSALSPAVAAGRYLADPVGAAPLCRSLLSAQQGGDETPAPQRQSAHAIECVFCAMGTGSLPDVPAGSCATPRAPDAFTVEHLPADASPANQTALHPINPQAPPHPA